MKHYLWILLVLAMTGCEDTETLSWKARQYHGQECEKCPAVEVSIPEGPENNRIAEVVHQSLQEEIIQWLDYAEENKAETIEAAIASFGEGYRELIARYPDETVGWEARIEGLVRFETAKVLSISLDGYIFTGGAHGYSGRRILNFDMGRAAELESEELFSDLEAFRQVAEAAFRKAHDIPGGKEINSTGFMFEENQFHLPEQIGFTPEGLLLYYNTYEVASYADGPIELTIPYKLAAPYISERLQPLGTDIL